MQHDPLIEQWLQQQELQLRQSLHTLISQVRLTAIGYSAADIDLQQLQQAQQQDQQQLRQLQQWLMQAQAEKAEALQSLSQLAEQLKVAQQEFRDEKLLHAQTQQQLVVLQQQATVSAADSEPTTTEPITAEPTSAQAQQQPHDWLQIQHKLESQLFRAQARADALEERHLSEAEQSRDTIRELRQQLQQQQQAFEQLQQQLQDVHLQVTEYRLKFEYAQSQLLKLQG